MRPRVLLVKCARVLVLSVFELACSRVLSATHLESHDRAYLGDCAVGAVQMATARSLPIHRRTSGYEVACECTGIPGRLH